MSPPRVRFAPSPTGYLHVGGARTALFNWLYARHTGGTHVLRIEDTDRERSTEEHTRVILDGLTWLGITWDEGPYFQGEYAARHQADAERLLAEGKAYRCFCTREELDAQRASAEGPGAGFRYDRRCYASRPHRSQDRVRAGTPSTIRFIMGDEEIAWDDAVHGRISFQGRDLDDFVILRSDNSAIYNLAVVSDDIAMRITHVIRGDDHISNTPEADRPLPGAGPPAAGLRSRSHDPRSRRQEAFQAAWRYRGRRLPGAGDPSRRHAQLPRSDGLVTRRRPRDPPRGRDDPALHPRGYPEEASGLRHRPSWSG